MSEGANGDERVVPRTRAGVEAERVEGEFTSGIQTRSRTLPMGSNPTGGEVPSGPGGENPAEVEDPGREFKDERSQAERSSHEFPTLTHEQMAFLDEETTESSPGSSPAKSKFDNAWEAVQPARREQTAFQPRPTQRAQTSPSQNDTVSFNPWHLKLARRIFNNPNINSLDGDEIKHVRSLAAAGIVSSTDPDEAKFSDPALFGEFDKANPGAPTKGGFKPTMPKPYEHASSVRTVNPHNALDSRRLFGFETDLPPTIVETFDIRRLGESSGEYQNTQDEHKVKPPPSSHYELGPFGAQTQWPGMHNWPSGPTVHTQCNALPHQPRPGTNAPKLGKIPQANSLSEESNPAFARSSAAPTVGAPPRAKPLFKSGGAPPSAHATHPGNVGAPSQQFSFQSQPFGAQLGAQSFMSPPPHSHYPGAPSPGGSPPMAGHMRGSRAEEDRYWKDPKKALRDLKLLKHGTHPWMDDLSQLQMDQGTEFDGLLSRRVVPDEYITDENLTGE